MIKIITHNGNFHADEVFAIATILLFLAKESEVSIIRTRDNQLFKTADYLIDVGGEYDPQEKRFDHHQPGGAGERANGIPYASFGLVWKEYGMKLTSSEEIAHDIERKLVMFIDALDNGVEISDSRFEDVRPYTISDYLYSYWIDEQIGAEEIDRIFKRVVSLAKTLIEREIEKAKRIQEEGRLVELIYKNSEDKKLIILDKHLAWGKVLTEKVEPLIVVYPSPSGFWHAKAIRKSLNGFETRILFPESWAGKAGHDIEILSEVPDATFCHAKRFLVAAKSKEGAISLAKKALEA